MIRPAAGGPDVWVVVPAGGLGVRMGRKKQDIRLDGRPLLRWTLDVLEGIREIAGVVVAVPAEDVEEWRRRLGACRKVRAVVAGGRERQESVARGLAAVPPTAAWILVHDGARPCITPELIRRVVEATQAHGAAIAALPGRRDAEARARRLGEGDRAARGALDDPDPAGVPGRPPPGGASPRYR